MSRNSLVLVALVLFVSSEGQALENFGQQDRGTYSTQNDSEVSNADSYHDIYKTKWADALSLYDFFTNEKSHNTENGANENLDQRQTDAEESMAVATWVGSFLAFVSIFLLIWTLGATRKMNRIMEKTHVAEIRPWVSIKLSAERGFEITTMGDDGGIGYILWVEYIAKNHGPSPATNVIFHADMCRHPGDKALEELMRNTGEKLKKSESRFSDVIFPDGETKATKRGIKIERNDAIKDMGPEHESTFIVLYGLIQYHHMEKIHQTRFWYYVGEFYPDPRGLGPGANLKVIDLDWSTKKIALFLEKMEAD